MNLDLFFHRLLHIPYTLHVRNNKTVGKVKTTIVFIHGLGGTGEMWDSVISQLKIDNVRIITLDLVGFGKSAKPKWATYNTTLQARSLRLTLAKHNIHGKIIIVGHSLGSLVAIETAKLYPKLAKSLILCSPPLYTKPDDKALIRPERVLRKLFNTLETNKDQFVAVSEFATKYKVAVNKSFNVTRENVDIFLNTLHAAITNQTAMDDIININIPVQIMHGLLDPLVISANLYDAAKKNPHVHVNEVASGHEVLGLYEKSLIKMIQKSVKELSQ